MRTFAAKSNPAAHLMFSRLPVVREEPMPSFAQKSKSAHPTSSVRVAKPNRAHQAVQRLRETSVEKVPANDSEFAHFAHDFSRIPFTAERRYACSQNCRCRICCVCLPTTAEAEQSQYHRSVRSVQTMLGQQTRVF